MNVRIKQGKHRSNLFLPCFVLSRKVVGTVIFKDDFSYLIEKQKDTNKLFGLSDNWFHHQDSVRIGWRWDVNSNKIQIMGIFYTQGERTILPICFVDSNVNHNFVIYIEDLRYVIKFNYKEITYPRLSKWKWFRYYLYPFFGGTTKAPKDFNFRLHIIKLWRHFLE